MRLSISVERLSGKGYCAKARFRAEIGNRVEEYERYGYGPDCERDAVRNAVSRFLTHNARRTVTNVEIVDKGLDRGWARADLMINRSAIVNGTVVSSCFVESVSFYNRLPSDLINRAHWYAEHDAALTDAVVSTVCQ